jgi:hypothetical protein
MIETKTKAEVGKHDLFVVVLCWEGELSADH